MARDALTLGTRGKSPAVLSIAGKLFSHGCIAESALGSPRFHSLGARIVCLRNFAMRGRIVDGLHICIERPCSLGKSGTMARRDVHFRAAGIAVMGLFMLKQFPAASSARF